MCVWAPGFGPLWSLVLAPFWHLVAVFGRHLKSWTKAPLLPVSPVSAGIMLVAVFRDVAVLFIAMAFVFMGVSEAAQQKQAEVRTSI
jgi:hypothetical protein